MGNSATIPSFRRAATAPSFTRPQLSRRQASLMGTDIAKQLGHGRLLLDLGSSVEALDLIEDAQRRIRQLADDVADRPRSTRRVALITALLAVLVGLGVVVQPPAQAAVVTDVEAVRVVVDQRTERFVVPVRSTAATRSGWHGASVWVGEPSTGAFAMIGSGVARQQLVRVRAQLSTTGIDTWGRRDALVVDDVDGHTRAIALDVRRRSRAALNHVEARSGDVALGGRLEHYSPEAGSWVSSQRSPVLFQERTSTGWKTVARATTTADGLAGAVLPLTPGAHRYRMVRPDGATVWGATSTPRALTVPGC